MLCSVCGRLCLSLLLVALWCCGLCNGLRSWWVLLMWLWCLSVGWCVLSVWLLCLLCRCLVSVMCCD